MITSKVIIEDNASPFLSKALREMEKKQPIHLAMAEGVTALVQDNFAKLSVTNRNRFGARGGFWLRMIASTKALATSLHGYVLMPRAVALRFFGGVVRPVRGEFLSLPARTEAYNRSPRDFNDLRFVPTRKGGMLVQRDQTTLEGRSRLGALVFYWLVRSVTIRPDSRVLPSQQAMAKAAAEAGEGFIRRRLGLA